MVEKIIFGIVGGIGPLASADLFFKLTKATPAIKDSDHFHIYLEQHPLTESDYALDTYDPSTRKLHIYNIMSGLEAKNVSAIILTCFISHTFILELSKAVSVPIINMMDAIVEYVSDIGVQKVGVLTSDFVRKQRLFEEYFNGMDIVYPDQDAQSQLVMEAIYGDNGIKAGKLSGKVVDDLVLVCQQLQENGAEVIIPGFTEVPVIHQQLLDRGVPILDTNQIYAEYAIRFQFQRAARQRVKVGVIGGLGPSATVDLMKKIVENTPASKDQDHIQMIVDHNPQIPDRTENLVGHGEDPTIPLFKSAKNLEAQGVDFIVIPCNTAHAFIGRIQQHLSIPIVNMIEAVRNFLTVEMSFKKAGLLATTGTLKSRVYHHILESSGVEVVAPDERYQAIVMDIVYGKDGVKASGDLHGNQERLFDVARHLVDKGAECLILGCTELPLLVENGCFLGGSKSVFIDPTVILAKKCVELAFE